DVCSSDLMMALNMSKEVLSAFGLLDERLTESNQAADARISAFMADLGTKASEQPDQYGAVKVKADQVNAVSQELDNFIEGLKNDLIEKARLKPEDMNNYEVQDVKDHLDQMLFNGDKYTELGDEFLAKLNNYRTQVIEILGDDNRYDAIVADINRKFNTEPVTRRDGVEERWLNYHYEGFPLIASKTKFTQLQN